MSTLKEIRKQISEETDEQRLKDLEKLYEILQKIQQEINYNDFYFLQNYINI